MKTIKTNSLEEIPENFTGIAEYINGDKVWYKEGNLHREDGPAIEAANGTKKWYKNGKYHRTDGPAVEYTNGYKAWYVNGKNHRTDGPAIEYSDGTRYWFLNSEQYFWICFKNYIVLDQYQGEYDLMWYKLLDKDEIFEYPDIPGLIIK